MPSIQLEIATFSLKGCIDAAKAGAHRIELCENAGAGGTTPSYGMLKQALLQVAIPIFPIIRPRGGDFTYSDAEFGIICDDVICCRELGYQGVVVGMLTKQGNIHQDQLRRVMELAGQMEVTFHRAFDRVIQPLQALEEIIDAGCKRILTSGQYPSCMNGLPLIKHLVQQANDRIIIMPGSGLNSTNVRQLLMESGAIECHTAARKNILTEVNSPESMNETLTYTGVDSNEIKLILNEIRYVESNRG